MSIKRKVARVRIKVRKVQRDKERRDLKRLAMARNKALRKAEVEVKKAKLKEEARQAQLKEMKAKGVSPRKSAVKSRTKGGVRAGKGIAGTLKKMRKFVRKHSR